MIANFKGKQNTNGFSENRKNINKNGRPYELLTLVLEKAMESGDTHASLLEIHNIMTERMKRKNKKLISIKKLILIKRVCFLHWFALSGGDLKEYQRVYKL